MLCFMFFLKCMFAKKYSQKLLVLLVTHLQSVCFRDLCQCEFGKSQGKSIFQTLRTLKLLFQTTLLHEPFEFLKVSSLCQVEASPNTLSAKEATPEIRGSSWGHPSIMYHHISTKNQSKSVPRHHFWHIYSLKFRFFLESVVQVSAFICCHSSNASCQRLSSKSFQLRQHVEILYQLGTVYPMSQQRFYPFQLSRVPLAWHSTWHTHKYIYIHT